MENILLKFAMRRRRCSSIIRQVQKTVGCLYINKPTDIDSKQSGKCKQHCKTNNTIAYEKNIKLKLNGLLSFP
jgi:hypothetical protein